MVTLGGVGLAGVGVKMTRGMGCADARMMRMVVVLGDDDVK